MRCNGRFLRRFLLRCFDDLGFLLSSGIVVVAITILVTIFVFAHRFRFFAFDLIFLLSTKFLSPFVLPLLEQCGPAHESTDERPQPVLFAFQPCLTFLQHSAIRVSIYHRTPDHAWTHRIYSTALPRTFARSEERR